MAITRDFPEPEHDAKVIIGKLQAGERSGQSVESRKKLLDELAIAITPQIHRYLKSSIKDPNTRDDLTQEVLIKVIRNFQAIDLSQPFNGWLSTVTRHVVYSHLKKQKHKTNGMLGDPVVLDDVPSFSDIIPCKAEDDAVETAKVRKAMTMITAQFKPKTMDAFTQLTIDGLPPQEVAGNLNMTVGAVYVAKSRVLGKLQEVLREMEESKPAKRF